MYVKDDEINQYFNNHNWNVATNHFKNSTIDKMSVFLDNHLFKINAHVHLYQEEEECNIDIDKSGSITSFNCSCDDCKDNELACSHIGITLFKFYGLANDDIPYLHNHQIENAQLVDFYKEKEMERKLKKQFHLSHNLIEQYQKDSFISLYPTPQNKILLNALVKEDFDKLLISYRIGNEKTYMIKHLGIFIENVRTNSFFSYGKALSFNHDLEVFDDFTIKQINFIKNNITGFSNELPLRNLELNNKNIDDFFELYADKENYIDLNFYKEDLQNISIKIKKEANSFKLFIDKIDGQLFFGKSRIYCYDKKSLYQYSSAMSKACKLFIKELLENDIINTSNKEMHYFCKYVLCKVIPYVQIKGDEFDEYFPYQVNMQLYVDLENNDMLSISTNLKKDDQVLEITKHSIEQIMMKLPINIDQAFELIEQYFQYDYVKQIGYMEEKGDNIYDFIKNTLPLLNNVCEVFVSEEIKTINNPKPIKMQIGVQIKNNLLEIDLSSIDISKKEIVDVLNSYQRKKKYHRLKNGEVINLDDVSIKEIAALMNNLQLNNTNFKDTNIILDASKALYLNQFVNDSEYLTINRAESFDNLI